VRGRLRLGAVVATALAVMLAPSPAAAKVKTSHRCVSVAAGFLIDRGTIGLDMPILDVPKNGKKRQSGVVTSVTAGVRISHTHDSDVHIALVNPAGRAIALSVGRGGAGAGYGSGPANCTGSLVGFGDAFTTPISTPGNIGNAPILGSFRPEQPLSTFTGGPARGTWAFVVSDRAVGDTGAVDAYELTVTYTYKQAAKKKKK
jgi:hypothetical protein